MGIATLQFESAALNHDALCTVVLPRIDRVGPGPYNVLVQLHGYYDAHTSWLYKSKLERHVEHLPLIVVLPGTENNWWSNLSEAARYEDLIVQDLWNYIRTMFHVRPNARWAIGGNSMGGFGSIRLGLKHPDKFCSIYAHSSRIPTPDDDEGWLRIARGHSLTDALKQDLDCYRWAQQVDRAKLPRLTLDCGVGDFLLDDNRTFHAFLESIGLPHSYHEHEGEHTWDYWDRWLPSALEQHMSVFGEQAGSVTPASQKEA